MKFIPLLLSLILTSAMIAPAQAGWREDSQAGIRAMIRGDKKAAIEYFDRAYNSGKMPHSRGLFFYGLFFRPLLTKAGRCGRAVALGRQLVRTSPDGKRRALARLFLAQAHDGCGQYAQAARAYQAIGASYPLEYAKFLATCPQAQFRNGALALKMARKGVAAKKSRKRLRYWHLETLAASHAAAGDFTRARAEQQKALKMARDRMRRALAAVDKDPARRARIQKSSQARIAGMELMLARYKSGKAWPLGRLGGANAGSLAPAPKKPTVGKPALALPGQLSRAGVVLLPGCKVFKVPPAPSGKISAYILCPPGLSPKQAVRRYRDMLAALGWSYSPTRSGLRRGTEILAMDRGKRRVMIGAKQFSTRQTNLVIMIGGKPSASARPATSLPRVMPAAMLRDGVDSMPGCRVHKAEAQPEAGKTRVDLVCPGLKSMPQVMSHYRQVLPRQGWRVVKDKAAPPKYYFLGLRKGKTVLVVGVRSNLKGPGLAVSMIYGRPKGSRP